MPEAAYYGQSPYRYEPLRSNLDSLGHHSFLNVQLEIRDPEVWNHMVLNGTARIDHSGCYSRLVALICGHFDEAIQIYLGKLPVARLERPRPNMERAMQRWLAGDHDAAIAEVDRIVALPQQPVVAHHHQGMAGALHDPAVVNDLPSCSSLMEAVFFCAAYLSDAERVDSWTAVWGEYCPLTPHEKMTIHRLLGQHEAHHATLTQLTTSLQQLRTRQSQFAAHRLLAETMARQAAQNRPRDERYRHGMEEDTWALHYEMALRNATSANEWCHMARMASTYVMFPYDIHEGRNEIPAYLDRAEKAATCCTDWRVCASTCLCTWGDVPRARRSILTAVPRANTTDDLIACSALCRWYGMGSQDDVVRILTAAEQRAVSGDDLMQCYRGWCEAGERKRAEALRPRIGASAYDDDLEPQPPGM